MIISVLIFILNFPVKFIFFVTTTCTPPQFKVHPQNCCNIPDFFDDSDIEICKTFRGSEGVLRPVEGLQKNENKNGTRVKRFATSRMEFGTCYLDCVFAIRAVKLAGNLIDYEKLKQILVSETPTEPDSINSISQAVQACKLQIQSSQIMTLTSGDCFPTPASIMMCVHQKYFMSCPLNRWLNTADCNLLKNYLLECPPPF